MEEEEANTALSIVKVDAKMADNEDLQAYFDQMEPTNRFLKYVVATHYP